ncbi:MAG: hypothetical protein AB7V77_03120 [Candidatus Woesearchaeota archaeon]
MRLLKSKKAGGADLIQDYLIMAGIGTVLIITFLSLASVFINKDVANSLYVARDTVGIVNVMAGIPSIIHYEMPYSYSDLSAKINGNVVSVMPSTMNSKTIYESFASASFSKPSNIFILSEENINLANLVFDKQYKSITISNKKYEKPSSSILNFDFVQKGNYLFYEQGEGLFNVLSGLYVGFDQTLNKELIESKLNEDIIFLIFSISEDDNIKISYSKQNKEILKPFADEMHNTLLNLNKELGKEIYSLKSATFEQDFSNTLKRDNIILIELQKNMATNSEDNKNYQEILGQRLASFFNSI